MNRKKLAALFFALIIAGCENLSCPKQKVITLVDDEQTPDVTVTMREKGDNDIIATEKTDEDGEAQFRGNYSEGKTYVFMMKKGTKKSSKQYTVSDKDYKTIRFLLEDINLKKIRFTTSKPFSDIQIFGSIGNVKKLFGSTDEDGSLIVTIKEKDWPSISFSGRHPDGNIVSNNLNRGFMFKSIPSDIELYIYPGKMSYFPMQTLDNSNRPIRDVRIISDQLGGKEWKPDKTGKIVPSVSPAEMEDAGIELNDKITFRISSDVYEKRSQTFFANTEKYDRGGTQKKIILEQTLKAFFQVLDDQGNAIRSATVYANGKNQGKTDQYGKIGFDYKDKEINKQIAVKAFKKGFEPRERSISLSPKTGKTYSFRLQAIEPIKISVLDDESDNAIDDKKITINGKSYQTDAYGIVEYIPETNKGKLTYNYSGQDIMHYPASGSFDYSLSERYFELKLVPQTVLIIETFYRNISSNDTLPQVKISIDGNKIGYTDDAGMLTVPLSEEQREDGFNITAFKKGFEKYEKDLKPTSKRYKNRIILKTINGSFTIRDVNFNLIKGIEVINSDQTVFKTNKYGIASVRLDELGSSLEFTFRDPEGRYQTKTDAVIFSKKGENKDITLIREPVKLEVKLMLGGVPAKGKIYVTPPPDPKKKSSGYRLKVGRSSIDIYNPNEYKIRYETVSPVVTGDTTINISMDKKLFTLDFGSIPLNATFKAIVDDGRDNIEISVYLASGYGDPNPTEQIELGTFTGNGVEVFSHPDAKYGTDLVLVFKRSGWSKKTEERITLNKPEQSFKFVVGDDYAVCKEKESKKEYEGACDACSKVKKASADYCDSRETMRIIYKNNLKKYDKALAAEWDFIDAGQCVNTYSDYIIMFELASNSQIRKVPKNLRDPNTVIDYFGETMIMIPLQVQSKDREKMETSLKQFTSAYTVKLIEYKIKEADGTISDELADDILDESKQLYGYLKDRFVEDLPPGIKGQYLDKATKMMKGIN